MQMQKNDHLTLIKQNKNNCRKNLIKTGKNQKIYSLKKNNRLLKYKIYSLKKS